MGTGGPTPQSTPTYMRFGLTELLYCSTSTPVCQELFSTQKDLNGDPYRIRTDVNGVRGRCLNHLTNGPHLYATLQTLNAYEFYGAPSGTRTRDLLIKSQPLYQLS